MWVISLKGLRRAWVGGVFLLLLFTLLWPWLLPGYRSLHHLEYGPTLAERITVTLGGF